jgi:hypothetical protein
MSTPLTSDVITKEALRVLHQEAKFVGSINKQYDNSFAQEGAKIGSSLRVRLPAQFVTSRGATLVKQDYLEQSTTLAVQPQFQVGLEFTAQDLTLSLDDFSARVIRPAMANLAANIDAEVLNTAVISTSNQVNGHGAANTFAQVLQARKLMNDNLAPMADRSIMLNTQANVDIIDATKGLFQDSSTIAKQYKEGMTGRTAGFDFYESTVMSRRARGAATAAYVLTANPANGATSIAVGTGTGTLVVGDVFTIAGVFSVHPETKVSTGVLQQFTVTSAYAGGVGNISFTPALWGPLAATAVNASRQNVSALPVSTNTIAVAGTISTGYGMSLAYHKDAFTFATADLVLPKGVDFASRQVFDGISMRMVRQYDINTDNFPCRIDVLAAWGALRPQTACRIAGL